MDVSLFMAEMAAKLAAPTQIPGWSHTDVAGGTKGLNWGGHSLDSADPLLANPELHQRCRAALTLSAKELKARCKQAELEVSGSKKVLSLRLAFQQTCPDHTPPASAAEMQKRRAENAKAPAAESAAPAAPAQAARRRPANLDDTAAVDRWKCRLAQDRAAADHAAALQQHAGASADELLTTATSEVAQVVANVVRGDCPHPLESLWLMATCDALGQPGALRILATVSHGRLCLGDAMLKIEPVRFFPFVGSEDAATLQDMGKAGFLDAAAGQLGINPAAMMTSELGPAAIEAMVDLAVADEEWDPEGLGQAGAAEVARLKSKFAVWLHGTTWGETFTHSTNRPSQASWNGDPWDSKFVMRHRECGLRRGLPATSVLEVSSTMDTTPAQLAAASEHTKAESFVQLWSANGGGESLGAGEAIEATLAVWRETSCELLAAQAATQQKQAPAGSKAKRRKTGRSTKK